MREPWRMGDFRAHVAGRKTFGHYTNDQESLTKLIVFDIDLDTGLCEKYKEAVKKKLDIPECCEQGHGTYCVPPMNKIVSGEITSNEDFDAALEIVPSHPRTDWRDRQHPGRPWYKQQLRCMVEMITGAIQREAGLACAAAYSGNKGCHVYAFFDEPTDIALARVMALEILAVAGDAPDKRYKIVKHKGSNFFKYDDPDPYTGYENLTIEVFPKQDTMDGKDLGNLVRLPLGVNHKGPNYKLKSGGTRHEPTFFIDQRLPYAELQPHPDPVGLLRSGDPYDQLEG